MKFIVQVLIFWGLWGGVPLSAAPDAAIFKNLFEGGVIQLDEVINRPKSNPASYEYVLVGGIISDCLMRIGYYETFVKELLAQGVPRSQIHLLFPPSTRTVAMNAKLYVAPRLEKIAAHSPRQIVLIGHSKGCVEVVEWFFNNTTLDDRIEAFFSIQGAFGGSPIADMLSKRERSRLRPAGLVNRAGITLLQSLNRWFHGAIEGVDDLTTAKSEARLTRWRDEHSHRFEPLSRRAVFLRSQSEPKLMDLRTRVGAHILISAGILDNDGALPIEHQYIPGLEAPVVSVKGVDHGLPCGDRLARRHHSKAQVFIRALLHSIGR